MIELLKAFNFICYVEGKETSWASVVPSGVRYSFKPQPS
jgi:hypothetical protein